MPVRKPVRIERGDLVAVRLAPGPAWIELVSETWSAGATLFPIDARLPEAEVAELERSARPTITIGDAGIQRLDEGNASEGDLALVAHTSGTGGIPKLVEIDRSAVEAAVAGSSSALGARAEDPWLCCLPLAHVGGLLVLLRAILLGSPMAVHERFDAERFDDDRDAVFTSLVPTMLLRLLDAGADLRRFRAILVGGARLAPDLRARAESSGANVIETYGLTESLGGVVYDGRSFLGTSARITTRGEIELRGPTLMRGYRSDPAASAAAYTEDGWLRTSDVGELDEDGRLRVLGRLDSLITSGGERVWPEEVEAVLVAHPKVADVAVTGRADPGWGERVVAVVVPTDATDPPTLDELREAASARLPRYKAPRELLLTRAIPRTPSGKVRRAVLARELPPAE